MLEFLELQTGRTCSTTVLFCPMGTVQVLGIGKRQLQLTNTRYTCKELCMGNPSLTHRSTQLALHLFLSYDLAEKQFLSTFNFQLSTPHEVRSPFPYIPHQSDTLCPDSSGRFLHSPDHPRTWVPSGNGGDSTYRNRLRN